MWYLCKMFAIYLHDLTAVIKKIDHSLGLEITYRTLHGADMSVLCARIVKCLEAGGAAAGCQLDWRFTDPYLNMWPNICLGSTVYSYLKRPGKHYMFYLGSVIKPKLLGLSVLGIVRQHFLLQSNQHKQISNSLKTIRYAFLEKWLLKSKKTYIYF